jgi:hypothetical protein
MGKMRILAVDDNSISLAAIEQELKKEYEVIPVNSVRVHCNICGEKDQI